MKQFERKIILFDFFAINFAWIAYYVIRIESHLIDYNAKPDLILPLTIMYIFWMAVFMFFGLYRPWYAQSRLDEFSSVTKAVSAGCIIIFFLIFFDDESAREFSPNRPIILIYWGLMIAFVGLGRVVIRSFRRSLLKKGIGLREAAIVGTGQKATELYQAIKQYSALGYSIVGFIDIEKTVAKTGNNGIIGHVDDLASVIKERNIKALFLAFDSPQHDAVLDIVAQCTGLDVSIKILPDMYDIVRGQARTNQIYGFPFIEVMPHIMQPWEESAKRLVDIIISIAILILSSPLWIFIGVAIKVDSAGPIVFSQERVGKDGRIFWMHKFRSMRSDAETTTGPVWAPKDDPRVTRIGGILRKTRLDEIPQFIDVLRGDMSLVGPRPERPFFVDKLSKEIPLYKRRLVVRPGITGWAQIKQGYDQTIDDVRSKVRYDLFYIENMSFRMDIKILLITFYTMIAGKGH
ncbi:MAG: sugar transferase [Bacteroidota bacterium]|nr:sugar transferase [Bacteroidota bacterium]